MQQMGLLILFLGVPTAVHAAGFDRVQINVGDPPAAAHWYANNLGGHLTKVDSAPAVSFGKMRLSFSKVQGTIGESTTSGIDHLGFSYENLDAAMQRFAKSGVRVVSGIEKDGPVRYAFIHDPWATLIEVVEDPEIRGFHHIHLATTDPKATLKWYTETFGGKVARFAGLIAGIRYGDEWILVKQVERRRAPTKGRAIDHLSWPFTDLDHAARRLENKGVRFETGPGDVAASRSLFVHDPAGVRLELVRPAGE